MEFIKKPNFANGTAGKAHLLSQYRGMLLDSFLIKYINHLPDEPTLQDMHEEAQRQAILLTTVFDATSDDGSSFFSWHIFHENYQIEKAQTSEFAAKYPKIPYPLRTPYTQAVNILATGCKTSASNIVYHLNKYVGRAEQLQDYVRGIQLAPVPHKDRVEGVKRDADMVEARNMLHARRNGLTDVLDNMFWDALKKVSENLYAEIKREGERRKAVEEEKKGVPRGITGGISGPRVVRGEVVKQVAKSEVKAKA